MSYKIQPVSKPVLFGESPLWDNRRQQLVFTNAFGKSVSIFDPLSEEIASKEVKIENEEFPWIVVSMPYSSSTTKFLVALSTGKLVEFDWDLGVTKILYSCENNDNLSFLEDGKCDSQGRYWTGIAKFVDMRMAELDEGKGSIFSLSGNLGYKLAEENYTVPNGLGWNKEGTKLFWNDLTRRQMYVVANRKILLDYKNNPQLEGSFPDGLCTDVNGNVWIANWKGKSVVKVDGETGTLLDTITLPTTNVTSLCFGGPNYDSMYVTTTSINLDLTTVQGEPDAGKLFRILNPRDNSFKGVQESFFAL
ncbi:Regucalcin [Folsomia candida]|uniref:Regucalcin n=1 Tax=Folsomia candida TaxID=158441 RepID=A0A226ECI2_FOLCA|nr:Regucalcin [Folsomia candida]